MQTFPQNGRISERKRKRRGDSPSPDRSRRSKKKRTTKAMRKNDSQESRSSRERSHYDDDDESEREPAFIPPTPTTSQEEMSYSQQHQRKYSQSKKDTFDPDAIPRTPGGSQVGDTSYSQLRDASYLSKMETESDPGEYEDEVEVEFIHEGDLRSKISPKNPNFNPFVIHSKASSTLRGFKETEISRLGYSMVCLTSYQNVGRADWPFQTQWKGGPLLSFNPPKTVRDEAKRTKAEFGIHEGQLEPPNPILTHRPYKIRKNGPFPVYSQQETYHHDPSNSKDRAPVARNGTRLNMTNSKPFDSMCMTLLSAMDMTASQFPRDKMMAFVTGQPKMRSMDDPSVPKNIWDLLVAVPSVSDPRGDAPERFREIQNSLDTFRETLFKYCAFQESVIPYGAYSDSRLDLECRGDHMFFYRACQIARSKAKLPNLSDPQDSEYDLSVPLFSEKAFGKAVLVDILKYRLKKMIDVSDIPEETRPPPPPPQKTPVAAFQEGTYEGPRLLQRHTYTSPARKPESLWHKGKHLASLGKWEHAGPEPRDNYIDSLSRYIRLLYKVLRRGVWGVPGSFKTFEIRPENGTVAKGTRQGLASQKFRTEELNLILPYIRNSFLHFYQQNLQICKDLVSDDEILSVPDFHLAEKYKPQRSASPGETVTGSDPLPRDYLEGDTFENMPTVPPLGRTYHDFGYQTLLRTKEPAEIAPPETRLSDSIRDKLNKGLNLYSDPSESDLLHTVFAIKCRLRRITSGPAYRSGPMRKKMPQKLEEVFAYHLVDGYKLLALESYLSDLRDLPEHKMNPIHPAPGKGGPIRMPTYYDYDMVRGGDLRPSNPTTYMLDSAFMYHYLRHLSFPSTFTLGFNFEIAPATEEEEEERDLEHYARLDDYRILTPFERSSDPRSKSGFRPPPEGQFPDYFGNITSACFEPLLLRSHCYPREKWESTSGPENPKESDFTEGGPKRDRSEVPVDERSCLVYVPCAFTVVDRNRSAAEAAAEAALERGERPRLNSSEISWTRRTFCLLPYGFGTPEKYPWAKSATDDVANFGNSEEYKPLPFCTSHAWRECQFDYLNTQGEYIMEVKRYQEEDDEEEEEGEATEEPGSKKSRSEVMFRIHDAKLYGPASPGDTPIEPKRVASPPWESHRYQDYEDVYYDDDPNAYWDYHKVPKELRDSAKTGNHPISTKYPDGSRKNDDPNRPLDENPMVGDAIRKYYNPSQFHSVIYPSSKEGGLPQFSPTISLGCGAPKRSSGRPREWSVHLQKRNPAEAGSEICITVDGPGCRLESITYAATRLPLKYYYPNKVGKVPPSGSAVPSKGDVCEVKRNAQPPLEPFGKGIPNPNPTYNAHPTNKFASPSPTTIHQLIPKTKTPAADPGHHVAALRNYSGADCFMISLMNAISSTKNIRWNPDPRSDDPATLQQYPAKERELRRWRHTFIKFMASLAKSDENLQNEILSQPEFFNPNGQRSLEFFNTVPKTPGECTRPGETVQEDAALTLESWMTKFSDPPREDANRTNFGTCANFKLTTVGTIVKENLQILRIRIPEEFKRAPGRDATEENLSIADLIHWELSDREHEDTYGNVQNTKAQFSGSLPEVFIPKIQWEMQMRVASGRTVTVKVKAPRIKLRRTDYLLDLTSFYDAELRSSSKNHFYRYLLSAVVAHQGSTARGGHYICLCRKYIKGTNQWSLVNDGKTQVLGTSWNEAFDDLETKSEQEPTSFLNCSPTLYFYNRIGGELENGSLIVSNLAHVSRESLEKLMSWDPDYEEKGPECYLSDEIINAYFYILQRDPENKRPATANNPRVLCASTLLLPLWVQHKDKDLPAAEIKKKLASMFLWDMVDRDLTHTKMANFMDENTSIYFPVHIEGNHWALIEHRYSPRLKFRSLTYYDSMGPKSKKEFIKSQGHRYCQIIAKMIGRLLSMVGIENDYHETLIDLEEGTPKQRNSVDCGVYMCVNARQLAQGADVRQLDDKIEPDLARIGIFITLFNHNRKINSKRKG